MTTTTETKMIRGMVRVEAAGTPASGQPQKFKGVAYQGGSIRVAGFFDPVVVDLAGLEIAGTTPVMVDHSATLRARLGQATASIINNELHVAGELVPGTGRSDRAIQLLTTIGLSLSIGASALSVEKVAKGASASANGRTFSGPITVVRKSKLIEISAVGVGADPGAVAVAASKKTGILQGDNPLPNQNLETQIQTLDPVAHERERIAQIHGAFRGLDSPEATRERDELIEAGADLAEAQGVALRLLRASRPTPNTVRGGEGAEPASLEASAARLLGASDDAIVAAGLTAPTAPGPESLLDFARQTIHAGGATVPASTDGVIRAAFSTDSFSGALGVALGVVGLEGFASAAEPALQTAYKIPLPDFKPATIARLNGSFIFEPIGAGGELKNATVDGDTTPIALETKGAIVSLTRKAIINDDRQLLAGVPRELGREAARSIGDAVNTALDDTAGTFFTSARGNLLSGAQSALSVDALTTAISSMRTQRDNSGRVVNMGPKFLLVGADMEATARSIINSTDLGVTDGSPRGNPMQKAAEVLVDARIAAGEWFLISEPQNAAIVLATLAGKVAPNVQSVTPPADQLGIGWRAWLDYGVALHEWRAVVKSLGA